MEGNPFNVNLPCNINVNHCLASQLSIINQYMANEMNLSHGIIIIILSVINLLSTCHKSHPYSTGWSINQVTLLYDTHRCICADSNTSRVSPSLVLLRNCAVFCGYRVIVQRRVVICVIYHRHWNHHQHHQPRATVEGKLLQLNWTRVRHVCYSFLLRWSIDKLLLKE